MSGQIDCDFRQNGRFPCAATYLNIISSFRVPGMTSELSAGLASILPTLNTSPSVISTVAQSGVLVQYSSPL